MSLGHFLDASSGHLSAETWHWLDEQTTDESVRNPHNSYAEILGGRTRYGWFIYAAADPVAPIPADLRLLMRHARQRGAEYILLDCDALPMEDLPVLHPDFLDQAKSTCDGHAS